MKNTRVKRNKKYKKLEISNSNSGKLPESVLAAERERIKQGVSPEAMAKAEKDFESLPEDMKQKFYRTFGK